MTVVIRSLVVLCLAILAGCSQTAAPSPTPEIATPTQTPKPVPTVAPTREPSPSPTPTLAEVLSYVQQAVVQVKTPSGSGSGFFFDKSGLVLTNAHVVASFRKVTVLVRGAGPVESLGMTADVVGVDQDADLAVVSVGNGREYPTLELGDSDAVSLGDDVVAMGYPLSPLLGEDIVATRGIVSSKRRIEGAELIQTDAALNRGGSGGPLLTRTGAVIGINTISIGSAVASVEGVGLAIPINHAKELLPSLMAGGPMASATPSGDLFDFGDAPDPLYPTKLESNGARHMDVTRAWMGEEVDVEGDANQQEDVLADTGDEADDGIIAALPLGFSVTNLDWDGPLYMNIILDLNDDGDWDDAGEWAIQNMELDVSMGVIKEFHTDLVFGPDLHLRMTLTGSPLTDYNGTGEFDIGETEDHMWTAARTGGSF